VKPTLLPAVVSLVLAPLACTPHDHGEAAKRADAQPPGTSESQAATPAPTPTLGAVYRIDGDIQPPELLTRNEPISFPGGKERKAWGPAILEAVIDETGNVRDVRLLRAPKFSPPWPGFEKECQEQIGKWRYKPATRNGKPVAVYLTITVLPTHAY
jgi:outer membrane biosynthesis protein TonB